YASWRATLTSHKSGEAMSSRRAYRAYPAGTTWANLLSQGGPRASFPDDSAGAAESRRILAPLPPSEFLPPRLAMSFDLPLICRLRAEVGRSYNADSSTLPGTAKCSLSPAVITRNSNRSMQTRNGFKDLASANCGTKTMHTLSHFTGLEFDRGLCSE